MDRRASAPVRRQRVRGVRKRAAVRERCGRTAHAASRWVRGNEAQEELVGRCAQAASGRYQAHYRVEGRWFSAPMTFRTKRDANAFFAATPRQYCRRGIVMTVKLVLIAGLPGAGKTSLARQLEETIPAVRLCGDEWMSDLGIDLQDEAARERIEVLFWKLAQRFLALGQSVILESGFWLRSDRDEKRLGARALGVSIELHYLDVPLDERWRRIGTRNQDGMWN